MKKWFLFYLLIPVSLFSQEKIDQTIYSKALDILDNSISIDSHCDTPMRLRDSTFNLGIRNKTGCFDLVRMKEGKLSAEFFAIFLSNSTDTSNPSQKALDIIQRVYKAMDKNKDIVELAYTTSDVRKIFTSGKRIICLGMENGGPIEGNLGNLAMFYQLGIRYITLTHSSNNHICDSSTDTTETWHGLSSFGKKLVLEMNKLGVMIDASHISDKSFWDAINLSKAPIIVSHSCCRAISSHPRNLSDDMIRGLAKNGGVLQLNFYPAYLDEEYNRISNLQDLMTKSISDSLRKIYKENDVEFHKEFRKMRKNLPSNEHPEISKLIDHIDHIVKLVGIDYVGIGSDFDGLSSFPKGLEDVSKMPMITYNLVKRGYSESDIKKIIGGNFLRVWKKVEEVSIQLQK